MSISYPLTPPSTPKPSHIEWHGQNIVSVSRSPFTLQSQVVEWDGDAWGLTVGFDPLSRDEAAPWMAFLQALRGQYGTFLFGDTLLAAPQGTGAGSPKVDGASQTGFSLATKGWTPSSAVLKKGDLIQIDNSMYQVLTDAAADGSGDATLDIWPRLRGHANDTSIVTNAPKCLMRLTASQITPILAPETQLFTIAFEAEEAV